MQPIPMEQIPRHRARGSGPDLAFMETFKNAKGKYQCVTCDKSYLHFKHLKRHYMKHTGNRPHVCRICQDTFCRSDILKRHYARCLAKFEVTGKCAAVSRVPKRIIPQPNYYGIAPPPLNLSSASQQMPNGRQPAPQVHYFYPGPYPQPQAAPRPAQPRQFQLPLPQIDKTSPQLPQQQQQQQPQTISIDHTSPLASPISNYSPTYPNYTISKPNEQPYYPYPYFPTGPVRAPAAAGHGLAIYQPGTTGPDTKAAGMPYYPVSPPRHPMDPTASADPASLAGGGAQKLVPPSFGNFYHPHPPPPPPQHPHQMVPSPAADASSNAESVSPPMVMDNGAGGNAGQYQPGPVPGGDFSSQPPQSQY